MPSTLNFYINCFWLFLLASIVVALIHLHRKVKRTLSQHQRDLRDLETQQQQQVKRLETIEQQHQTILQDLAGVFDRLDKP